MLQQLGLNSRRLLVIAHDLVVTAAAIIVTFYLRSDALGQERLNWLLVILPGFLLYAGFVYNFFDLYRSKWRFASLPDLSNIFRAVSILALSLLVLDYVLLAPNLYGTFFFGKVTILLYWLVQMFFLGGPRIAYRYFRYTRTRHHAQAAESASTLILGRAADAEVLIRAIESGAVKKIWPVGIL
jgi:FlaA1/EpsC-like NDP-sugar epimerase